VKDLSSCCWSSPARAAPVVTTNAKPNGTTASRRARIVAFDEFRTIQPLALVWRIALFLSKITRGH
jgi:hypothetical protein